MVQDGGSDDELNASAGGSPNAPNPAEASRQGFEELYVTRNLSSTDYCLCARV